MNPVTGGTAKGTVVGTVNGARHVLGFVYTDSQTPHGVLKHVYVGMCRRTLRGNLFVQTDEDPTCQKCIDERDFRAAQAAGFEHNVRALRRPLGHSPIAGNNAMRYGAQVDCFTCPSQSYDRTIWFVNQAGQMRKAEEYARQHYLTAYRESLTAEQQKPDPVTAISPARLVELRVEGKAKVGQFVDPHVLHKLTGVLAKRGETWAAAILGRDISRRSIAIPAMPYLNSGEEYTLVAADAEEDRARFDQITTAETGE